MTARGEYVAPQLPDSRWMARAACARSENRDLPWLADEAQISDQAKMAMAGVCADCPVLDKCDAFAIATDANAAFWAGHVRVMPWEQLELRWSA
jgi:hypothetical protein